MIIPKKINVELLEVKNFVMEKNSKLFVTINLGNEHYKTHPVKSPVNEIIDNKVKIGQVCEVTVANRKIAVGGVLLLKLKEKRKINNKDVGTVTIPLNTISDIKRSATWIGVTDTHGQNTEILASCYITDREEISNDEFHVLNEKTRKPPKRFLSLTSLNHSKVSLEPRVNVESKKPKRSKSSKSFVNSNKLVNTIAESAAGLPSQVHIPFNKCTANEPIVDLSDCKVESYLIETNEESVESAILYCKSRESELETKKLKQIERENLLQEKKAKELESDFNYSIIDEESYTDDVSVSSHKDIGVSAVVMTVPVAQAVSATTKIGNDAITRSPMLEAKQNFARRSSMTALKTQKSTGDISIGSKEELMVVDLNANVVNDDDIEEDSLPLAGELPPESLEGLTEEEIQFLKVRINEANLLMEQEQNELKNQSYKLQHLQDNGMMNHKQGSLSNVLDTRIHTDLLY